MKHLENLIGDPDFRTHLQPLLDCKFATLNAAADAIAMDASRQTTVREDECDPQPSSLLLALKWINKETPSWAYFYTIADQPIPIAPHARAVARHAAEREMVSPTTRLLNETALISHEEGKLEEAEAMYRRALELGEAYFGPDHFDLTSSLGNLAATLKAKGQITEAEALLRRSLNILAHAPAKDQLGIPSQLYQMAEIFQATDRLPQAERILRKLIQMAEETYGEHHQRVASLLADLAKVLYNLNRNEEAEALSLKSSAMRKAYVQELMKRFPKDAPLGTNLD